MKALRIALAIVIAWLALVSIRITVIRPQRCNQRKKAVRTAVEAVFGKNDKFRSARVVSRHSDEVSRCLSADPTDVELWMEKAALSRLVDQNENAINSYQSALSYDHRPEIYRNLGEVQLSIGRRADAVGNFAMAAIFDARTLREFHDKELIDEIIARAAEIVPWEGDRLRSWLADDSRSSRGPRDRRRVKTD